MLRTRGVSDKSRSILIDSRCKNPWTVEEDNLMKEIVKKLGCKNWTLISQHFQDRSGKQCRERWHNHLNPGIKKGDWTDQEDRIIATLQRLWGNQWAKITTVLPGRTDNAVKNRYHATIRSKLKKGIQFLSESEILSLSQNINTDVVEIEDYDEDEEGFNLSEKYNDSTSVASSLVKAEANIIPNLTIENLTVVGTVVTDYSDTDDMNIPCSPVSDSIESIDMSAMTFSPLDIDIQGIEDWINDDSPSNSDPISDDFDMEYDDEDKSTSIRKVNDSKCFTGWNYSDNNNVWFGNFSTNICQNRNDISYKKENNRFCGFSYLNQSNR
eukprot:gene18708-24467_t